MNGERAYGQGKLTREQRGSGPARWVLTWTDALGQRRRETLSTDKRVAEQVRAERIRQRDLEMAGLGTLAGQERLLTELAEAYLEDLATRATRHHVLNVRLALRRMLAEIGVVRVRELRPYEVVKVRARLVAEGLAVRTANVHVSCLRAMLTWAASLDLIAQNPLAKLKALPERRGSERRKRRALTDEEISLVLAAAEEDDRIQSRRVAAVRSAGPGRKGRMWALRGRRLRVPQAAWWHALLGLGCRYGELRQVRWVDLDLKNRVLLLRASTTKGNRERRVPIHEDLAARFVALREEHAHVFGAVPGPRDFVFLTPNGTPWPWATTNLMRLHNRILELAGVERTNAEGEVVDLHSLRRSAASRLARGGVSLVQAAQLLGHADTRTTSRHYVQLGVEDLRGAAERLSPPVLRQPLTGEEDGEAPDRGRASG